MGKVQYKDTAGYIPLYVFWKTLPWNAPKRRENANARESVAALLGGPLARTAPLAPFPPPPRPHPTPPPAPAPAKMAATQTSLFKLFFECYNEFDAKFDAVPATSSIICFGVSGAGKSAFLARLLSRLDPSGFKAALPKDSIVSIEGVNVGGTIGSTTLVPVMYNVGGELQIFDVPGFKDTDEERQVVINILHKCLLTRVQVRPRVLLNVAPIGWCNG